MRVVMWVGIVATAVVLIGMACFADDTPTRPKISGIVSVQLDVSNETAADRFYSNFNPLMGPCPICKWQHRGALLPTGQEFMWWATPSTPKSNRVKSVGFQIGDLDGMMSFLKSKKIHFRVESPLDGDRHLIVVDPEGHEIRFIEFGRSYSWLSVESEIRKAAPAPIRLIHVGFVVKERAAMDKFYKDVLGFHVYWTGGMKDGETDWVDMQVPDGTDWIEYMLNVPENADKQTLGIMNHIALGVPDVRAAAKQLEAQGMKLPEPPQMGRDGKWQLNFYDPDDTRVELMEFTPTQKPCCSDYTGPHPKP